MICIWVCIAKKKIKPDTKIQNFAHTLMTVFVHSYNFFFFWQSVLRTYAEQTYRIHKRWIFQWCSSSNISLLAGIESERDPGEATWAWKGITFLTIPRKKFWTPNLFEVKLAWFFLVGKLECQEFRSCVKYGPIWREIHWTSQKILENWIQKYFRFYSSPNQVRFYTRGLKSANFLASLAWGVCVPL